MNPKELFTACTTQCVWCKEQWPIEATDGHLLHVGPFTQDKHLFSTICKAESIRQAFEYIGYKGGKQIKFKARSPEALKNIIANYYEANRKGKGLGMHIDSPKNRSFWRTGIRCTLDVAEWPEWKRSHQMSDDGTYKPSEPTSPERLKSCRDELRFFDECDFITRRGCSEGLQYRPVEPDSMNGLRNMPEPTCNGGFGCTTCWERYEKAYGKMSEGWCD
jgi:hypothetical protein